MDIESIWLIITTIITAAAAITAATPTPKEGSKLATVYRLIDWAALHFGHAKDKGDDKDS